MKARTRILAVLSAAILPAALHVMFAQNAPVTNAQFGSITGKLLALDGTPAVNVRVSALLADSTTQENTAALLSITQTDNTGRYRLENVRPGRYFVIAGLVDSPSYFPGVGDRAKATIVTIGPQETLTGLDFRMAIPTGMRFSGRVIRQNSDGTVVPAAAAGATAPPFALVIGTPIAQAAQIRMNGVGGGVAAPVASIAPDGSFAVSNVRPGRYDVQLMQPGASFPRLNVTVTLTDKDITDFQLVVPFMAALSGTMSIEGGGPLPRIQLAFTARTAALTLPQVAVSPAQLAPRLSVGRTFTTQLSSGEYAVAATGLPAGFEIKSIMAGAEDLSVNTLKVSTAGMPPLKIVLAVSSPSPWVRLAGRVVGRAERYRVVNFNVNSQTIADQIEPDFYLDGSFEIPMVLPGQYMFLTSTLGSPNMNTMINVGSAGVTDGVIYVPDDAASPASGGGGTNVRVSGRIVGRAKAYSGAKVRMTNTILGETLSAPIYMDGSFELPRVSPGTYAAEVYPAIPGASPTSVVVSSADLRDLRIAMPDTREIAGRVLTPDGVPVPRSMEISVGGHDKIRFALAVDGSFQLTLPAGQKLAVNPGSIPTGYVVESMKYGTQDLLVSPITFTGSSTDELRVTLRNAASLASVRGRVVGFAALPSGSHVWLTDPSGGQRTIETSISADGTFLFTRVAAGTYIARLSASGVAATAASSPVVVSGSDIDNVEITAAR